MACNASWIFELRATTLDWCIATWGSKRAAQMGRTARLIQAERFKGGTMKKQTALVVIEIGRAHV